MGDCHYCVTPLKASTLGTLASALLNGQWVVGYLVHVRVLMRLVTLNFIFYGE